MKKQEEEIDPELGEFIEKFREELPYIQKTSSAIDNDSIKRINLFYNSFHSYQLAKFTKKLFYATLMLFLASALQTISIIYGKESARNVLEQSSTIIINLGIIIVFGMIILKIIESIFEKIKKVI